VGRQNAEDDDHDEPSANESETLGIVAEIETLLRRLRPVLDGL
jgi:hypothetical protein